MRPQQRLSKDKISQVALESARAPGTHKFVSVLPLFREALFASRLKYSTKPVDCSVGRVQEIGKEVYSGCLRQRKIQGSQPRGQEGKELG